MKKLASKVFLIGISLGLMTACTNATDKVEKAVQDVQESLPMIVQSMNEIQAVESKLQETWENEIYADNTLASLATEGNPVLENVDQRLKLVDQLGQDVKTLKKAVNSLSKVDSPDLPTLEIQIIVSNLNNVVADVEEYVNLSKDNLAQEREFFIQLGQAKEYKDLAQQVATLNELAAKRQAIVVKANTPLTEIDKPIRILKARLNPDTTVN